MTGTTRSHIGPLTGERLSRNLRSSSPIGGHMRKLTLVSGLPLRLAAVLLLLSLAAALNASTAGAKTGGPITIQADSAVGKRITDWGYDIKQPDGTGIRFAGTTQDIGKAYDLAHTEGRARKVFFDHPIKVLRIPIYAVAHREPDAPLQEGEKDGPTSNLVLDGYEDGDPSNQKGRDYDFVVDAVKAAQAAAPSKVTIFASLKLEDPVASEPNNTATFPIWVTDAQGRIAADNYKVLICNYLKYMKSEGVTVDVIGFDNEGNNAKGNITPWKHYTIVTHIKGACGFQNVKILGPASYGPADVVAHSPDDLLADGWLKKLAGDPAWWGTLDYAATHYYSKHRIGDQTYPVALSTFREAARPANIEKKVLWDPEFHWNTQPAHAAPGETLDPWTTSQFGLISAFDQFDQRFQGMVWWNFRPWDGVAREPASAVAEEVTSLQLMQQLHSELVRTTAGALWLPTDDHDGDGLGQTKFNTRAFIKDNELRLWVINDVEVTPDMPSQLTKFIQVSGAQIDTSELPTVTRWSGTPCPGSSTPPGETGCRLLTNEPKGYITGAGELSMSFPMGTISAVRIPLVP